MKKYIQNHISLWLFGLLVPALTSLATNLYFAEQLQHYSSLLFTLQPSFQKIAVTLGITAIILLLLTMLATRYHNDIVQSTYIISHDIRNIVYPFFGFIYLAVVLYSNLPIGILLTLLGIGVILLNALFLRKKIAIQKEVLHANEFFTLDCNNVIHGKMSI